MQGIVHVVERRPVCSVGSAQRRGGRLRGARRDKRSAGVRVENERLLAENARLRGQLEEARRAGKRQAAPFSRGEPKKDPARPGRKSGEDYGTRAHRPVPDHVDEEILVPLPEACPCCRGELVFEDWVDQYQEEIVEVRGHVRRFRIGRGRCRRCGKRAQGRHPDQTSDAIGAAGGVSEDLCRHERKRASCPPTRTAGSRRSRVAPASSGASPEGERSEAPAPRPPRAPRCRGCRAAGLLERPELSDELVDELLAGARTAEEIAGPDGLLGQLTRRLLNRALEAELTEHLGYEPGQAPPGGAGNARNGKPAKTILTDQGPLRIRSPRDRNGTFEPQIVKKRQTRWVGFDDRVISLYARGLTVREIQGHLAEIYGTEVSPDLISKITDTVLDDAKAWQNRPLERVYPIVYLDALVVKIRDGHTVRNQACYVAMGVNLDGERDVLGLWFQRTEGAKFWLHVLTDLKTRGVADILFVCVDGLTGFPEAIEAVFPHATGADLPGASGPLEPALRVLQGPQARRRRPPEDLHRRRRRARRRRARSVRREVGSPLPDDLRQLARALGADHPVPGLSRRRPPRDLHHELDRGAHRQLRKIIKTRGHFPTEDAARKLIYLAITRAETKWRRALQLARRPGRVQDRVRRPHPRQRNLTVTT